jgi:hypothetical protein
MTTPAKVRGELYRAARVTGDLDALRHGPTAYLKRRARRVVYRNTGQLGRSISRALGL